MTTLYQIERGSVSLWWHRPPGRWPHLTATQTTGGDAAAIIVGAAVDIGPPDRYRLLMKHSLAIRSLCLGLMLALASSAAPNLAPLATITADTEWSRDWGPEFVADGRVVPPGGHDKGLGWAVRGETHRQHATLTLAWPQPVRIAELVAYQRACYGLGDCLRTFELRLDDQPVMTGELRQLYGAQPIRLPQPRTARRLTLQFTSSFGGDNPGLAELQVFADHPRASDLVPGVPLPPEWLKDLMAAGDTEAVARLLWQQAETGNLDDAGATLAAQWLGDPDPWVRAPAEWALALRVGYDNNNGAVVWPGAGDAPAWYRRWQAVPRSSYIELDWVRHALVNGLADDPAALRADLAALVARGERTAALAQDTRHAEVAEHLTVLRAASTEAGGNLSAVRAHWLLARRAVRGIALARRELAFDQLAFTTRFAPHHKSNVCGVHYSFAYKPGGDLCVLDDLRGDQPARGLLADRLGPGHVHGADLSFAGDKLVFAWASQPVWPPRDAQGRLIDVCHQQENHAFELMKLTQPVHLWEMGADGGEPRQLTHDDYWSDVEPTWLPNGGVVFSSDRSAHAPSCDGWENDITDLNLYRLSPDRQRIRRLANHKDIDMHPHVLDNGMVGYLRWEYQERDFWDTHSFWVMRPDGTGVDARFKQHFTPPYSVREVRSIPGSSKLAGIAAGHHTYPVGPLVTLNPGAGLNSDAGIGIVAMGSGPQEGPMGGAMVPGGGVRDARGLYLTPYPLSEDCFLTSFAFPHRFRRPTPNGQPDVLSNDASVYLVDTLGNKELLYRDPLLCVVQPMPFRPRPAPPVLPDATDYTRNYATCLINDVREGVPELAAGQVRYLRIMEALPWPVTRDEGSRYLGGASFDWQIRQEQVWNPVRVIGTVPVDPDGSAHFKVPVASNASVYFQILDENHMELRRMRSSVSFQPGEVRGCHGCHETRANAGYSRPGTAAQRQPDLPDPPSWGMRPLGYEWLVQPVLDRRCVSCHGGSKPAGGLDLTPRPVKYGLDTMVGSYQAIRDKGLVACSNQRLNGAVTGVKQFGSHASRLVTHLRSDAGHAALGLTADEWLALVTWVDANCPYNDLLYNKRPAGGGAPRREPFPWHDPWAAPSELSN